MSKAIPIAAALAFLGITIQDAPAENFDPDIAPLIDTYCISCHDADTNEAGLDFDQFLTAASAEKNSDLWEKIATFLEMGEMPPREKKQPTAAERQRIIAWASGLSEKWDSGEMGRNPGRTTIRRLNKCGYNYTSATSSA